MNSSNKVTSTEYHTGVFHGPSRSRMDILKIVTSWRRVKNMWPLLQETTITTPVENPLSEIETREIFHGKVEETLSSHEIEAEPDQVVHSNEELDPKAPEVTEDVDQSIVPASTLAFSTPSNRATMESVELITTTKDDIPVLDEAKAEIPSQTEQVREIFEIEVAAMTTMEHNVSKILKCISMSTDAVRRVVVYGACGVGKSSVLRALVDNPIIKREFEVIIWVTLSKHWSRKKILDQVIQQLPAASSNAEPSQILRDKKFLIVLDDVWQRIDLKEIGIPDPSLQNGSMMILATSEMEIFHDMEEIKEIKIEPLSKVEAWTLFHEQVGGVADLPSIHHFALGIVKGCCGLPLLIIVTGKALAEEKNGRVWEHAFNEFSMPGRDVKSRREDLLQLLKFSFDQLKSHSLKSCFLYFALFSEDREVNVSEYIEYCIQEGLIVGTWSDADKRGHDIVNALQGALLLEATEGGRPIRMHDVMRDLALGILSGTEGFQSQLMNYSKPLKAETALSSKPHEIPQSSRIVIADKYQYLCRAAAGLTEPPTEEEWKESKMIFLMDNKLSTLPEKPSCPQLLTLCLQRNYQLRVLPDFFFEGMPVLRLLNLSRTRIKYFPKSISCLGRLETLILRDCERLVNLPSEVGSLKLLKVLNLGGTELIELPKEVGKLGSLSYLEVSFYGSSTSTEHVKLPPKLISSLKALETLSISVYPGDCWWNKSVESFIKEVSSLKKLTSLSFYFPEVKFLELFLRRSAAWKKGSLTEFKFVVGRDIKFNASRIPRSVQLNYGLTSGQCLRFVNSEKIPNVIVKVLTCCTAFYLDHHLDIKCLSEFGIGNIKKLKYCIISECPDLETIAVGKDVTDQALLPSLEHLSIHYSWSLENIWEGVVPPGSFAALRTLSLHACPELAYVFRSSMLQFLSNLEELKVEDCENIEKIVSSEEVAESGFVSLKSLTLNYLPQLVQIWEGAQTQLLFEQISVYDCPQLKQISTSSELKQTLKEIRAEKDWWDRLVWEDKESCSHFAAIFTPILEDDVHSSPSSRQ